MTIDLRDPMFRTDPQRFLAHKQEEAAAHVDALGAMVVLRHAEVSQLLRDPRLGKDLRRWNGYGFVRPYGAGTTFESYVESWMLSRDPPDHTRLRRLASQAFTPRAVAMMRSTVEAIAAALLAELPTDGEVELMSAFAQPFPVLVICRIMGFPTGDFRALKRWSDGLAVAVELMPKKYPEAEIAAVEMSAYVREHIALRRLRPSDDLLTALVEAKDQGDRLSEDELIAMVMLLFLAAHETTTNLIGGGLLALLEAPDELARLRVHPELLPSAVEELTRLTTPGPFSGRAVHETFSLGDLTLPAGGLVLLGLSAANRDPRVFSDPDRLDVARQHNPHLAFGAGMHYCLGAPLARMEAMIAFERLLGRWPNIGLGEPAPRRLKRFGLRGLESLTLRVAAGGV